MLTNVATIDQAQVMSLYKFAIRAGGNIIILGPAGGGKTEMAMQASNEESFEFVYVNLSVLEAPDLVGLPMIDELTKTSTYATPKQLPLAGTKSKKVILVVDEIDKAKQELQNPMLELFQLRSINGRPLDVHAVIATGNLPDEGAFSLPISHALTNRCMVYQMQVAFEPFRDHAVESGVNPLVIGFLSRNTDWLLQGKPDGDDTAYCHPSPRAWTQAARDLDLAKDEDVDYQTLIIAGRVGTAAAIKFKVWLTHHRHIEPMIDALVKDGKHPNIEGMHIDRVMVTAIAGVNPIAGALYMELDLITSIGCQQ